MAYIVEQKIKGKIYLYKVESYWDKEKKQSRQKRIYIGPKEKRRTRNTKLKESDLVSKSFGDVFLLKTISDKLGITDILKKLFPKNYLEILSLAFYDITQREAYYLFPHWLEEHYLPKVKKLHSTNISELCEYLGRSEKQRINFIDEWIKNLELSKGVYYDITSISSYSTGIDFVEWGYNRDGENLPQVNMGLVFCKNSGLPVFYTIYPGSITDVTTLKNCLHYLKSFGVQDILLVLDRGFYSGANIKEMNESEINITFIQPLPFRLKKVKDLVRKCKRKLTKASSAFKFETEILHHFNSTIDLDNTKYETHIFFNEKAEIDQKHKFLSTLLEIEKKIKSKKLETLKESIKFRKLNIPMKYKEYFKWNKTFLCMERNSSKINACTAKMGCFLLITNRQGMEKTEILKYYRKRDCVEKAYNTVKNEIDGKRVRVHSQYNMEGRLFIKFLSLVLNSEVVKTMEEKKLFNKFTLKELLAESKKIKVTKLKGEEPFLSELSKKQKTILAAFDAEKSIKHSY